MPSLFPNVQCIPNVQCGPVCPSHPSHSTARRPRERPPPAPVSCDGSCPRGWARAVAPQAQGPPQAGWTREAQGWGSHGSSPPRGGVAGVVQVGAAAGFAVDAFPAAVVVPAVGPAVVVAITLLCPPARAGASARPSLRPSMAGPAPPMGRRRAGQGRQVGRGRPVKVVIVVLLWGATSTLLRLPRRRCPWPGGRSPSRPSPSC